MIGLLLAGLLVPLKVAAQKEWVPSASSVLDTVLLKEIRISGRKDPRVPVNVLSGNALSSRSGQSLAQVLQDVPGVSMIQTGTTITKPVINGLHGNRILILNNGVKQEGQQWGAEHAPEIDPAIAGTISVIKGAAGVRYGAEALGGVIVLDVPPLPFGKPVSGEAGTVLAANGGSFGGGFTLRSGWTSHPEWAWRIQGSGKKNGNFKTADYFLNNTGVRELNFSGEAGFRKGRWLITAYGSYFSTELGIFSGAHIGDTADLKARIQHEVPFEKGNFSYDIDAPRQQVVHRLYKTTVQYQFNDSSRLELWYAYQEDRRQEFDLRRAGRSAIPSLNLLLQTRSAALHWEQKRHSGWQTAAGATASYKANHNQPGTGVVPLIPNYKYMEAGVYGIQRMIRRGYELEAGLRYDHHYLNALGTRPFYRYVNDAGATVPVNEAGSYVKEVYYYGGERYFNNVSGMLGLRWKLKAAWNLSTHIGMAWRPPQVSELYSYGLHHGAASIEYGDSTLKGEQGYKWITTLQKQYGRLQLDASLYTQYIGGYIFLQPQRVYEQTIRGAFPVFRYQQTDALLSGLDLTARYRLWPALAYELRAAFIRARDIQQQRYLPLIPADRISHVLQYRFKEGQRINTSYIQLVSTFTARQRRYDPGSDFADPPPAYHLLHLEAGTRIYCKHHTLRLFATVSNLLNTSYKDYLDRFRYFSHGVGRNLQLRISYQF
ncbi:MAG: TonB-dependent receptor [Niabella sp.]|nr:TonB-dependent receptor [Niabella sp.]